MSFHHLESVENIDRSNSTTSPAKTDEATEVRASELAKGGLKYELVLAEPSVVTPPRQLTSPQKPTNVSLDEINKKLKEAEDRRLSMEAKKLSKISTKFEHVAEVVQRRESLEKVKLESIQNKLEANKENREKILNAIKERAKEHERHVEEVRQQKAMSGVEANGGSISSSG